MVKEWLVKYLLVQARPCPLPSFKGRFAAALSQYVVQRNAWDADEIQRYRYGMVFAVGTLGDGKLEAPFGQRIVL